VKEEFGVDLPPSNCELRVAKPVIADGRMAPHKWIDSDGALLKVDNAIHGDDHFFPGPTDIAWDLAGAIVEWELDKNAAQFLLDGYFRNTGDDAQVRVGNYLLAYSVFRTAFCRMAAASMQGSEEHLRLVADYHRYRARALSYLPEAVAPEGPVKALSQNPPELRIA